MPPIGGIPHHKRHAALRRAVHPVSRSVYPQTVQNARPTGQSLAPGGSRARRRCWAQDVSSAQRQTAWSTSDIFRHHWEEMARCLEEQPDQTALELLVEFQARHPGQYSSQQLYTLQKRVRAWRQQVVQRLIGEVSGLPPYVASDPLRLAAGNILGEAAGNRIT
jgi:hypothetical protein